MHVVQIFKRKLLRESGWCGEKIIFSALASVHTGRISEPINLGMTEYNTTSSHSWCCYMMCVNLLKSTPIGKEPAGIFFLPRFFFFWNMVSAKGKIKLKTDWCAINSPKNQTDKFVLFAFLLFTANKSNSSVHFLGESTARQSAFRFYLTFNKMLLHKSIWKVRWRLERVQNQHLLSVLYACFSL